MKTHTASRLDMLILAVSLCASALALGCESTTEAGAVGGDPYEERVEIDTERSSTPGELAVSNLSSQIEGRLAFIERRPDDLALRGQVVDLLLSRAHYGGSFADFALATDLAAGSVLRFPERPEPYEQRARLSSALHLFDAAATDTARAEGLLPMGFVTSRHDSARVIHALAIGAPLDDAFLFASERAALYPSYETLTRLAAVQAALGRYDEADQSYLRALDHYRDVSPFPLAWVAFQRGVMWAELADEPELAVSLYREAVRRLPTYVAANVHLAELEATLIGDPDAAIARLCTLVGTADAPHVQDPEPLGLLGELLLEQGATEEGGALVAKAGAMYEALLAAHPEAFADHASEFFAGPGADPGRAVLMSQRNLSHRQNPRAFIVAIEAAEAAGDLAMLCDTARRAETAAQSSVALDNVLFRLSERCP